MRAIEYRIKQKSQNLFNYGDILLIESRISTIFVIEYRIRDPHPAPLIDAWHKLAGIVLALFRRLVTTESSL